MTRLDGQELLIGASARAAVAALRSRCAGDDAPRLLLVGGAVRDLALGRLPEDLDVMFEGPIGPVLAAADEVLRRHERFETATIAIAGERLHLARARRETYPRPGALPVVVPASAEADLARRDFTVNALALDLMSDRAGVLLAVPGAEEDLQRRRLAVLHDASFIDDPTRMLRLARYKGRLGFAIEARTAQLARHAAGHGALHTVSPARIGRELQLLASEDDSVSALLALEPLGLWEAIAPGFGLGDEAQVRSALQRLPAGARRDLLVLGAASLGVASDERERWLLALELPRRDRKRILEIARRAPRDAEGLAEAALDDSLGT